MCNEKGIRMEEKNERPDKKIDESWKDKADQEKHDIESVPDNLEDIPVSLSMFISSLGMQALVALGELENPFTKKKEADLKQAQYIIDTIQMLQEKTDKNVTDEEKQMLDGLLYQLRMAYLEKSK